MTGVRPAASPVRSAREACPPMAGPSCRILWGKSSATPEAAWNRSVCAEPRAYMRGGQIRLAAGCVPVLAFYTLWGYGPVRLGDYMSAPAVSFRPVWVVPGVQAGGGGSDVPRSLICIDARSAPRPDLQRRGSAVTMDLVEVGPVAKPALPMCPVC